MIGIDSTDLTVQVLDPLNDRARLGSRYCTGGYIWQVRDRSGRGLLSGPRYPDSNPPVFDGQGMPEAFETPLSGADEPVGGEVLVIGVGKVRKSSGIEPFHPRNNPEVLEFCNWDVHVSSGCVNMLTTHESDGHKLQLERSVEVVENRVVSRSQIVNLGRKDVSFFWFAHPFFPLNQNLSCGNIVPSVELPPNQGYMLSPDGAVFMKKDYPWQKGLFQPLVAQWGKPLEIVSAHPVCGQIKLQVDFPVVRFPLWANANTFSFEPFLEKRVVPGDSYCWSISYMFG